MFEAVDSDSDDSIDPSENNLADEIDDDNIVEILRYYILIIEEQVI